MGFEINGERGGWQKMTGQGWPFPIKMVDQIKIAIITTGMVNFPAPFVVVVRLILWGRCSMGFVIQGKDEWQKMAGEGRLFPVK